MNSTAIETDFMIAFVLPNVPGQVGMARCLVRAALGYGGLEHYADDAGIITSELVTNAMKHADQDPAGKICIVLMRARSGETVTVVVTDSSPVPPVRLSTTAGSDHGLGMQVVETLSARWGWHPLGGGKAVYATLARKG